MILKPADVNTYMGERGLQFTTQEAQFLFSVTAGVELTKAARKAGFLPAAQAVNNLLERADITDALKYMDDMKQEVIPAGDFTAEDAMGMYLDAYAAAATSTEMKNVVDSMVKLKGLAAAEKKEVVFTNATELRGASEEDLIRQIGKLGGREIILNPEDYQRVK